MVKEGDKQKDDFDKESGNRDGKQDIEFSGEESR